MKKSIIFLMAAFAAALLSVSCNKEQNFSGEPQSEDGLVTITATIPQEITKVTGAYDGSKMALTWEDTDAITVKNAADESKSVVFTYVSGAGTNSAKFAAGDVSALAGATSFNISYNGLPGSFASQTQASDGDTGHVKYSVALNGVDSYQDIAFTSAWASAHSGTLAQSGALHLHATLPSGVAAVVNSVNMKAGALSINVALSSQTDTGSDDAIDIFATLPASNVVIPAGSDMLVSFGTTDDSHSVYTRYYEIPSTLTLQAGKLNRINLTCTNTDKYAGKDDDGTAAKPYLIADKYQLAAIADLLSTENKKYFKLVDNITVSSWKNINCNEKGAIDLDGNNKCITGLNKPLFEFFNGKAYNLTISDAVITATGNNYYGVFARTVDGANSCELTNVSIINSSLSSKGTVGGLVGKIDSTTPCVLTNCSADVDVTGTGYYLGGLVGQVTNGTISHCSATGDVSTSTHYASALIGYTVNTVTVEKCYATGNIIPTATNTANHGGIVASIGASSVLTVGNCYYTGHMGTNTYKTRRWCGGILGATAAGSTISVTNGYSSFTIDSANIGLEGALVGNNLSTALTCSGFVGWSSLSNLRGANTAVSSDGNYLGTEGSIYSQASALGGWDFVNVWTTDAEPKLR